MNPDLHMPFVGGRLSRRRFALALPLLGACAIAAPGGVWANTDPKVQRASRVLMGTRIDVVTVGTGPSDAGALHVAMQQAFAEMERLEALMSRYRRDSDVSRIGAASGVRPIKVAPEVMAVLRQAQTLHRESAGAFDPTIGALRGWHFEPGQEAAPAAAEIHQALRLVDGRALVLDEAAGTAYLTQRGMALDLGGVAKLPILQAGLQVLERAGVSHALINGGGDVLVLGNQHGRPWRVGVRNPSAPSELVGVLELEGRGVVASSGDYERSFVRTGRRLHHILNPKTGWPTQGVQGVALLANDIEAVNGWGTALMVRGPTHAPAWHAQHSGVEVMVAHAPGKRWISPGMSAALKPVAVTAQG
jgi:FAD:protein FMN transferase